MSVSGRGKVSRREFVRMVTDIFDLRNQLLDLIESQNGIQKVFKALVASFLSFIGFLVFMGFLGIPVNTLIISGAASLSSFTVAMSTSSIILRLLILNSLVIQSLILNSLVIQLVVLSSLHVSVIP